MVTIKMNVQEIIKEIDDLCFKFKTHEEVEKWQQIESQVRDWAWDSENMPKRLSRLSYFETLSDGELATLEKFHRGHKRSHPGRKSTVKAARWDLEYALSLFFKFPGLYLEECTRIEAKYPRSIVYKALKALC